jgi:hypothetical protein
MTQICLFHVMKEIAIGHQDLHLKRTIGKGTLKQTSPLDTHGSQPERCPGTNTMKCGRELQKDGLHR